MLLRLTVPKVFSLENAHPEKERKKLSIAVRSRSLKNLNKIWELMLRRCRSLRLGKMLLKSRWRLIFSFLEKIFADKKINSEVFFEKKEIVEARYEQELEEIEELRKVLRKNVDKTLELENNLKQNKKLL